MVKQYVGARYVPKFASPVEWAANTSYEALTIVTFNNASYTSKVPVPPTVGNPANNPQYWALTGNYNAQVEQYRQETETVSNNITTEITNRKNADTTLQGQITTEITNRKNADTTLQGQISAERTAREKADSVLSAKATSLQTQISEERTERSQQDAVLSARMNEFTKLPGGSLSTAADAELVDIRVKADGTSATTAGDAVREQASELKSDLTSFVINHYFLPTIRHFDNSYITAGTGTLRESNGNKATDFIAIPDGTAKLLFYGNYSSADVYNAFYDENEIFINSFTADDYVNVPENAKYVRCSFTNDVFNTIYFKTVSITELYNLAINTIHFQGAIKLSDFDASKNIDVIVSLNNAKNLGYYEDSNGITRYFTATQNGTELSTNEYKFTVPRYAAIVLDIKYSSRHSGTAQIEVKSVEAIKSNDIVLLSNEYNLSFTKIGGLMYEKLILNKISTISTRSSNNDKVMRSICRMGEAYGQPESVEALKSCHNAGYNIIRVNLQFSSDGTAVLWHDPYINQHMKSVYDSSGALVPYSETDRIKISDTPLAALNQYKWGGASYATGIPTADAIINAARKAGMELYFECKMTLSEANINTIVSLVEKYGMRDRVSFASASYENCELIATQAQGIRIGFTNSTFSEQLKTAYLSIKNLGAKMFWWGWDTMALTNEIVEFLSKNGIDYECGDFASYSAIDTYLSAEYSWYCTGMEIKGTMSPLIGQYIENNI